MRRYLPFVVIAAVGLLTLGSGTILYRAKQRPLLAIPKDKADERGSTVHALGNSVAPVTLEEFGDFQCPPCAALAGPIRQLQQDYYSQLRVIFRNFPLSTHSHAREAAIAAEAAGLQGRFWQMHELLYREQRNWSNAPDARLLFESYAGMLGLKVDRFKKDMDSQEVKERVTSDQERGVSLGVNITPTIFINNRAVPPKSLNPAALRDTIKTAMDSKPPAG